jgi:hypothetical protein
LANVFISYARRDRDRVLALASALEHEGLSVWWDPNLVPGKRFRDIIATELAAADSVLVVWTAASIQSDYVQDEAEEGRERGVLVPVTLEPVKPPAGFRQVQAADLSQWTGSSQHPDFRMVVTAVRTLVQAARADEAADAPAAAPTRPADPPPSRPSAAPAPTASDPQAALGPQPTSSPQPASNPQATSHPDAAPDPQESPAHPDAMFLPRLYDLFGRPAVWGTIAVAVLVSGVRVGFGLSGTAAALLLWAGAMASAGAGGSLGPSRKTTVMIISLGVMMIVAASTHSLGGLVTSMLVFGAVFAGTSTIMIAGGRHGPRRTPRESTRSHRAYWAARAKEDRAYWVERAKEMRAEARRRYRRAKS